MSEDRDRRRRAPGAFDVGSPEPRTEERTSDTASQAPRMPRSIATLEDVRIEPDEAIDEDLIAEAETPATVSKKRFSFAKLFAAAFGILVSLAFGLAIDSVVRELFARADWLGWATLGVVALLVIAALGIAFREIVGLMRLSAVDRERQRALAAYRADSLSEAKLAVSTLETLLSHRSETARGRAHIASLKNEVIDGADYLALAEEHMLGPLDRKARALVLGSAKRVSVVTAVSPKALVDVAYVVFENVKLIRTMSELYGARPGTLGLIKLTRDVLTHLAVTGSIAVGDSLVHQVVGHGVAARLSSRLGEGVVNGLLTARVGLAAMDLCRPLPFLRATRPRIGAVLSELAAHSGMEREKR
ncbi:YcjF family protein [Jiella marina]|uniref:YcjF family protein n=1 Tax=Jiella sp. LLJ827 TaxID=2917712 RepID=UPI00210142CE|nr:TIGR01620 family protein [Jiella sp. LLJ827]MCQ0989722.1 YcjF family protein [Jiella sp. LLJ827]